MKQLVYQDWQTEKNNNLNALDQGSIINIDS